MKVCDVVKNSIWNDPRVRKQIISYMGNDVELVCVGIKNREYNEEEVQKMPCPVELVEFDLKLNRSSISVFRKIYRELFTNRKICKAIVAQKPDIIHANDLNALVPAYKAAKKLKCKLVYDSHEIFLENQGIASNRIMRFIWSRQERKIIKKIDLMICVSNAAADYFAEKYNIKRPLVVTNCAISENDFDLTGIKKNDGFEVLNHGRYFANRGYDTMIDACALLSDLPEVKLSIRGFGSIEDELHKKADGLKNKKQFSFYPPVLVKEMIPEAAKSHIGVAITVPHCLNFKLSVSNKIFEYAAAGLPVIMSDIPEHRYLNDMYSIGIILEDNTPEFLAKAIRKLYEDKELYAKCVEGAKKMSREVTWEKDFGKLLEAERKLL